LAERKSDAERLAEILAETSIEITVRAGDGRIYGSVGNKDIAEALKAQYDVEIDRRKIVLAEPIKVTGEHLVPYRPHPEVTIDLKVNVVPEAG
jgi:large subunit ribosomal protein L9